MSEGITVVLMAYNEAASLEAVAREIHDVVVRLDRSHEILIVDDGSSDGTALVADRLARDLAGVRVVHHGTNRGLGEVYRTGFDEARRELVTFFPADGQFAASLLERLLPVMDEADFAVGYLPASCRSLLARFLSWAERIFYRFLFGAVPRFQGIFVFRRAVLEHLPLTSRGRGWAVVMEMIIRAARAGYRVRSVPIELRPRMAGTSKVQNPRTILSNLLQVLALRCRF